MDGDSAAALANAARTKAFHATQRTTAEEAYGILAMLERAKAAEDRDEVKPNLDYTQNYTWALSFLIKNYKNMITSDGTPEQKQALANLDTTEESIPLARAILDIYFGNHYETYAVARIAEGQEPQIWVGTPAKVGDTASEERLRVAETSPGAVGVGRAAASEAPLTASLLLKEAAPGYLRREYAPAPGGGVTETTTVSLGQVPEGAASFLVYRLLVEMENPYTDVSMGHWAYPAVMDARAAGLMNGTSAATFTPNGPVTRAQVWSVLARLAGEDASCGDPWYAPAQSWAVAQGVSDGTDPAGPVTREQLAAMLYRAAGSPAAPGQPTGFADWDRVSGFARDAMAWAVGCGVLSGRASGLLDPQAGATRAELAVMLQRYAEARGQ